MSRKPDIVAITETWLHENTTDAEIAISDYQLFRKDRKGRGCGALLFIRSSLRPKQQVQLKHNGIPFTDVVISISGISNTTLNILCVYRSTRSMCDQDPYYWKTYKSLQPKRGNVNTG